MNLNNDLSILIGSNGSGKTSVLLLLQAIICTNFKDLFNIPFGRYMIFYLSISDGIEIVGVLHGARDREHLFTLQE